MARWQCAACGATMDDLLGACTGCRDVRAAARGWPVGETSPGLGGSLFFANPEEAFRVGTLLVTYRREPAP